MWNNYGEEISFSHTPNGLKAVFCNSQHVSQLYFSQQLSSDFIFIQAIQLQCF